MQSFGGIPVFHGALCGTVNQSPAGRMGKEKTMFIGNVGMFVRDLEGAKNFFADYFDAKVVAVYNEEENGYYSYIMQIGDGPMLEIMTKPDMVDTGTDPNRTGLAHINIKVETAEKRDAIIAKLKQDGYRILYEPATTGGTECRAVTFEGIVLEINLA